MKNLELQPLISTYPTMNYFVLWMLISTGKQKYLQM